MLVSFKKHKKADLNLISFKKLLFSFGIQRRVLKSLMKAAFCIPSFLTAYTVKIFFFSFKGIKARLVSFCWFLHVVVSLPMRRKENKLVKMEDFTSIQKPTLFFSLYPLCEERLIRIP